MMTDHQRALKRARYQKYKRQDPAFLEKASARAKEYAARNPEKIKASNAERRKLRTAEQTRRYNMRSLHGLELEQIDALFIAQDGECAICQTPLRKPCVDHDHSTLENRGLLCKRCNMGLGLFRDSPVVLMWAAKYLTQYGKSL